jgi:protein required for attachment to host cells
MHAPKVLYIVADGGRARFIERNEAGDFRTLRDLESEHIHDRSRALGRGPPARVQESATVTRHAIEPRQDPHAKAEGAFIATVAEQVNTNYGDRYDLLVVAAPPRLAARFRKSLSDAMLKKLESCINKDLTKTPDKELSHHLPTLLGRRAGAS